MPSIRFGGFKRPRISGPITNTSMLTVPSSFSQPAFEASPSYNIIQNPSLTALPPIPQSRASRLRKRLSGYMTSARSFFIPGNKDHNREGGFKLHISASEPALSRFYGNRDRNNIISAPFGLNQRSESHADFTALNAGGSQALSPDVPYLPLVNIPEIRIENFSDEYYPDTVAAEGSIQVSMDEHSEAGDKASIETGLDNPFGIDTETTSANDAMGFHIHEDETATAPPCATVELQDPRTVELPKPHAEITDWRTVMNSLAMHSNIMEFAERPKDQPKPKPNSVILNPPALAVTVPEIAINGMSYPDVAGNVVDRHNVEDNDGMRIETPHADALHHDEVDGDEDSRSDAWEDIWVMWE